MFCHIFTSKRKAFSFVELSIALLVISALIVGILGGRALLPVYRTKTAQALTQSSPVTNVEGLMVWLETSMPDSFVSGSMVDGQVVTLWNDRNSQANLKSYAVAVSGANVTYESESDIYTLPSLRFDGGASTYFVLSKSDNVSDAYPIKNPQNAFTVFMVAKSDEQPVGSRAVVFSNGVAGGVGVSGYSYGLDQTMKRSIKFGGVGDFTTDTSDGSLNPEVVSVTYAGGSGGELKMYTNGVSSGGAGASGTSEVLSGSAVTAVSPLVGFYVGGSPNVSESWKGLISEVIVFNRVLSDKERRSIEAYLGQKYNIKVNTRDYDGACVVSINGVDESYVDTGTSATFSCASPQYEGSIDYTCNDGQLSLSTDGCTCGDGYSAFEGSCQPQCSTGDTVGVNTTSVNPTTAALSLSCDVYGYVGSISYKCINGKFTVTGGSCAMPSCEVVHTGVVTTTVAGSFDSKEIECNATDYYGTLNYTCVNGVFAVESGECLNDQCDVAATGVTSPTKVDPGTGSLTCNGVGYSSTDTITYSCVDKVFSVTGSTACDVCATGYSYVDGQCRQKCDATATGIYSTVVDATTSPVTVACNNPEYTGSMTYTCVDGVFAVTSNTCQLIVQDCSILINGVSQTTVTPGTSTLTCDQSGYSGTISYTCANTEFTTYGACKIETLSPACTGGTITTVSGSTVHTFTSSGTLSCTAAKSGVQILVVAAGGSGGAHIDISTTGTGGGGGGGVIYVASAPLSATNYTVTVAGTTAGKSISSCSGVGNTGANSVFSGGGIAITAKGGGGGGGCNTAEGSTGGSGGGHFNGTGGTASGGTATGVYIVTGKQIGRAHV